MVDWNQIDPEGAMRQRYLDVDELTEEAKQEIGASGWSWKEFHAMYDISWLYHENGLEGVVLTYPEIRSAADNMVVSDVSLLPRYRDIRAQKQCIEKFRDKAKSKRAGITIDLFKELHGLLLNDSENAGVYRKDIPIHRTYFHTIVTPATIEKKFQETLDLLSAKRDPQVHPIEFAATVHHRFMAAFPFSKHSGILGRLLLNYVLQKHHYLPAVIHATDRQRYYEALRGGERDFAVFLCETLCNGLENTLRFFRTHSGKAVAHSG